MNTEAAYIITEGKLDAELIKAILPGLTENPEKIAILAAPGYSAALSIAESVLIQTQRPVLLVIDADTIDELRIREKKTFIQQYVRINGMTCQVAFAVPSLEILFFADKSVLENALEKTIPDDVWTLARLSPKQALELLTGKPTEMVIRQLLANDKVRQKMGQTPLANEINVFIQAAQQPVSV